MIFEKKRTVHYAETGVNGKIKPVTILNYFQDIASEHTDVLGVSAFDLFPKNLAWVVFRYQIQIKAYPLWKDRLRIRTWRFPVNNLYELRQYEIYDDKDNLLISSKSSWILTSISTKKPLRLNKNLPQELMKDQQQEISNDLIALPQITSHDFSKSFNIRMHELDFNRHVNNSVYVVWAIESVTRAIISSHLPKEIIVNYIGESLYGDQVTSHTQEIETNPAHTYLHSIISNHSLQEITRVKTVWDVFE
jgi:medium-chain acyl-[acyl-carrier-protein] hydrolase